MTLKPVSKLALNYLLLGVLYMVSDQVYRYFKFKGSMSGTSFFFYDNFWFGWYYLLSMLYFLLVGATLMTKDKYLKIFSSTRNPLFWRLLKMMAIFCFLIECEGVLQFIYVSRDIEYQVEGLSEQQEIYAFVLLGVMRWSVSLFAISHLSLSLEAVAREVTGIGSTSRGSSGGNLVTGHGLSVNRLRLNRLYGWASQIGCDYFVLHYFLYMIFYSRSSPLYALKSDEFYHYPEKLSTSSQLFFSAFLIAGSAFYVSAVRKEVTFFNFVI